MIKHHEPNHSEIVYTLPSEGEYVLLVGDGFDFRLTGSYNRYIQRLNNPAGAVSFTYGNSLSGVISSAADMDTFQFSGGANERVQITVSDSVFDFWPEVRLYSPTGQYIVSNKDPSLAQLEVTLPGAGIYKILVCDGHLYNDSGSYNIHLQQIP